MSVTIIDKISTQKSLNPQQILDDYYTCLLSRELSLLARREVLTGKAKFGIAGAGKEVPLVAAAQAFQKGDYWSGYYRDQTFMLAKQLTDPVEYFASLYGDTENDSHSGGRQMNNHFSTPFIDESGNWLNQQTQYNVSSAVSTLGGQLPRALGLALASKKYRTHPTLNSNTLFSNSGNEVSFALLGDATTSEGVFFETVNAAGVLKVPMAFIILDDGYGISVPSKYQTTKGNISTVLEGFRVNEQGEGLDIYTLKAWDYETLCKTFKEGVKKIRTTHIPAIFHIEECTQPQGHSTSGSHNRYKSKERLEWEKEMDAIKSMESWMLREEFITSEEITNYQKRAKKEARTAKNIAWKNLNAPIEQTKKEILALYQTILQYTKHKEAVQTIAEHLNSPFLTYSEIVKNAEEVEIATLGESHEGITQLTNWLYHQKEVAKQRYHTHLHSETTQSALYTPVIAPTFDEDAPLKNGYEILNAYFDKALEKYPNTYAFGEDVGKIGGVNQAFAGMQQKYGEDRVFDTGIREWTIVGQGIGMAMRGMRPIAEIQYLDYLSYAFSALTDDLATLRYRTKGQQKSPVIIRTRGHRLEGIWHSGSPMGMLLHSMRGIYVLTPRNMTQAVGFYNTLLQSDDPAIVIECLNGYRLKEKMPSNIGEYTVPLGVPEILEEGSDVTLVTYGSCVRIAEEGINLLKKKGISVELIDVQSLLPFDLESRIVQSLKKTNRIVFLDEDVPGGATSFMMQEVLEKQGGYRHLDSKPVTVTAKAHRTPYGDDGDYFTKPNAIDVFKAVYGLMKESNPQRFL